MENRELTIHGIRAKLQALSQQKSVILRERDRHVRKIESFMEESEKLQVLKKRWERKYQCLQSLRNHFGDEINHESPESALAITNRYFRLCGEVSRGDVSDGEFVIQEIRGKLDFLVKSHTTIKVFMQCHNKPFFSNNCRNQRSCETDRRKSYGRQEK